MKKVISLLLALIMIFTTASAYSNDNDNISVAHAQVYHASGVNEYGTNILEKSEIEHDVPAKIITQNGCITIDMILDGNPIVISARLEGRNLSDNLLYYDAECISDGNIDVNLPEEEQEEALTKIIIFLAGLVPVDHLKGLEQAAISKRAERLKEYKEYIEDLPEKDAKGILKELAILEKIRAQK